MFIAIVYFLLACALFAIFFPYLILKVLESCGAKVNWDEEPYVPCFRIGKPDND